jgi:thiamine-monophosphate kinase
MSEKRTEISELGEFGLIEQLAKGALVKNPSTLKGIGDDAAARIYFWKGYILT